jgi:glutamate N-acetyltransferase/amino-acid N-acetyltransferase
MLTEIQGNCGAPSSFHTTGISCSIKKTGEKDLGLIFSKKPCKAVGVFTRNLVKAAPVVISKERIKNHIHAVIINSGNANACTGKQGHDNAIKMTQIVEQCLDIDAGGVLICSTGVIGEQLPMQKVEFGVNKICKNILKPNQVSDDYFAESIMTTDKRKKQAAYSFRIDNNTVKIGAAAKGSGMIAPNMATMLAFITTDANISRSAMEKALRSVIEDTFNSITIDGEMSTNDTVLLLANGAADNPEITDDTPEYDIFREALFQTCKKLALEIIKDGEGASKQISVNVKNAASKQDARKVAFGIANSLLFKTACFGTDPNWGRILSAAGSVENVILTPDKIDLYIGEQLTVKNGSVSPDYLETEAARYLKKKEISFTVDLKVGEHDKTVYTTDISFEYVRINSEYKS